MKVVHWPRGCGPSHPSQDAGTSISELFAQVVITPSAALLSAHGLASQGCSNKRDATLSVGGSTGHFGIIHDAFTFYTLLLVICASLSYVYQHKKSRTQCATGSLCLITLFILSLAENVAAAGRHGSTIAPANRYELLRNPALLLQTAETRNVAINIPPEDRGRQNAGSSSTRRMTEEYSSASSTVRRRDRKRRKKNKKQKHEHLECPFFVTGHGCKHRREPHFNGHRGIAELHKHLNKNHGLLYCTSCFEQIDNAKQWNLHHGRVCQEHERTQCSKCDESTVTKVCQKRGLGFAKDFVSGWPGWSKDSYSWPHHEHMDAWAQLVGGGQDQETDTQVRWLQMFEAIFGHRNVDSSKYKWSEPTHDASSSLDERSTSRQRHRRRSSSGATDHRPVPADRTTDAANVQQATAEGTDWLKLREQPNTFMMPPAVQQVQRPTSNPAVTPINTRHVNPEHIFGAYYNVPQARAMDVRSSADHSEYSTALLSQDSTPLTQPSSQPNSGIKMQPGLKWPLEHAWATGSNNSGAPSMLTSSSYQGVNMQPDFLNDFTASFENQLLPPDYQQRGAQLFQRPGMQSSEASSSHIPRAEGDEASNFTGSGFGAIQYPQAGSDVLAERNHLLEQSGAGSQQDGSTEQSGASGMAARLIKKIFDLQNLATSGSIEYSQKQMAERVIQRMLEVAEVGDVMLDRGQQSDRAALLSKSSQ